MKGSNNTGERKYIIHAILAFVIACMIKLFFVRDALPVRTLSDEVGSIASAALAAGYDWSTVVSNAGYYGGGFTIFLALCFKIFEDPITIYQAMLFVCVLVQSISVLISFYILKHYFKIQNLFVLYMLSITSSFVVVTRAMIVYNEHILIALSWVICLLMFKLFEYQEDKKRKTVYTSLLFLTMAYGLSVHTRAAVFFIAFAMIIVFFAIRDRKSIISIPVAIITGGIGAFVSQMFVGYIQDSIWLITEGEVLRNTQVFTEGAEYTFDLDAVFAWLNIILGQLCTMNVFMVGFFLVIVCMFIHILLKGIVQNESVKKEDSLEKVFFPAVFFFTLCVVMTIGAQSISWLDDAVIAMEAQKKAYRYGAKAFTYLRYMGPYIGPLFMVAIAQVYRLKDKVIIYFDYAWKVMLIFATFFMWSILPYLSNNTVAGAHEAFIPFAFSEIAPDDLSSDLFMPGIITMLVLYMVIHWLIKKKQFNVSVCILLAVMVFQYGYCAVYWDGITQNQNYYIANAGYNTINNLEDMIELPYEIYVHDGRNVEDHQSFYEYQFMLYDYKVIPYTDDTVLEGTELIFSNETEKSWLLEWENKGYSCYVLDENEVLITQNPEINRLMVEVQ